MPFFKNVKSSNANHYKKLHNKWTKRHASLKEKLLTTHRDSLDWLAKNMPAKHHIAAGSLSGLLLLAPTVTTSLPATISAEAVKEKPLDIPKRTFLLTDLSTIVPNEIRPLAPDEEAKITSLLSTQLNITVRPELQGIRLNTDYGYIGAEQHLMRYPGDTIYSHFQNQDEANNYAKSGMAPGRGAWGYFSDSSYAMTQKDIDREKYYIAVQTFLTPGYAQNVREYSEFFKYRKMLVVNPQNGKSVVVVIGDAGPAPWTGKQLGGSPEVMSYLERFDGKQRGPVLYFFIDDPTDKVPLGPIEL
ncbi:hypothetical protein BH09PAT1_BH09PAT1_6030 [soil metagenome]